LRAGGRGIYSFGACQSNDWHAFGVRVDIHVARPLAPDRNDSPSQGSLAMKRSALIVAGIAVSICSGCAIATSNQYDNIDTAKVATINQVARNRGLEVHWVNYPQRKSTTPIVPVSDAPTGT
jgi:hypothetical protein